MGAISDILDLRIYTITLYTIICYNDKKEKVDIIDVLRDKLPGEEFIKFRNQTRWLDINPKVYGYINDKDIIRFFTSVGFERYISILDQYTDYFNYNQYTIETTRKIYTYKHHIYKDAYQVILNPNDILKLE